MVEYVEGILKIANVFLAIVAGIIALSLLKHSAKRKNAKAWYVLVGALILFTIQEILGALRAFNIWSTPYLTHITTTAMLGLLIWAIVLEYYTKH